MKGNRIAALLAACLLLSGSGRPAPTAPARTAPTVVPEPTLETTAPVLPAANTLVAAVGDTSAPPVATPSPAAPVVGNAVQAGGMRWLGYDADFVGPGDNGVVADIPDGVKEGHAQLVLKVQSSGKLLGIDTQYAGPDFAYNFPAGGALFAMLDGKRISDRPNLALGPGEHTLDLYLFTLVYGGKPVDMGAGRLDVAVRVQDGTGNTLSLGGTLRNPK